MSGHPFLKIKDPLLGKLTIRGVVLCVFATIAMAMIDQPLRGGPAPWGIVSLELASDVPTTEQILAYWRDNRVLGFAKLLSVVDFVYLLIYGAAFSLLVCWLGRRAGLERWASRIAWWPIWAALCDVVENILLGIELVNERADSWASGPAAIFAKVKFAFLAMTVVFLIIAAVQAWKKRTTGNDAQAQ